MESRDNMSAVMAAQYSLHFVGDDAAKINSSCQIFWRFLWNVTNNFVFNLYLKTIIHIWWSCKIKSNVGRSTPLLFLGQEMNADVYCLLLIIQNWIKDKVSECCLTHFLPLTTTNTTLAILSNNDQIWSKLSNKFWVTNFYLSVLH